MTFISRILLIEDDVDDQEIFLSALKELNADISCNVVQNGRQALDYLSRHENPDLIILDLNMPLMDGRQFLKELKKQAPPPEIPLIVLSTASDSEVIRKTLDLGADKFFTKPEKFSHMTDILRTILEQPL